MCYWNKDKFQTDWSLQRTENKEQYTDPNFDWGLISWQIATAPVVFTSSQGRIVFLGNSQRDFTPRLFFQTLLNDVNTSYSHWQLSLPPFRAVGGVAVAIESTCQSRMQLSIHVLHNGWSEVIVQFGIVFSTQEENRYNTNPYYIRKQMKILKETLSVESSFIRNFILITQERNRILILLSRVSLKIKAS